MRVFDAHLHVRDPHFPLVPNAGFLPEPFDPGDLDLIAGTLGDETLVRKALFDNAVAFYRLIKKPLRSLHLCGSNSVNECRG